MKKDDLKYKYRINHRIREREVRLVGENVEIGVYSIQEALKIAEDQHLDLVEISPNAVPPVCRITDFQKFLYQKKKKEKEQKAKATKILLKEIRFGPQTDEHDYNFKLKHAIEFLKKVPKSRLLFFSKDVPFYSRNRESFYYCALPTTLKTMVKWKIYRYWKENE